MQDGTLRGTLRAMHLSRVCIAGVPIDVLTPDEAVQRLLALLRGDRSCHVATPNNEMIVLAQSHAAFRSMLQRCDLALPDSTGVVCVARCMGAPLHCRVTGADTVQSLCSVLGPEDGIFLLGGAEGIAERAAACLQQRYPAVRIAGTWAGSPRAEDADAIVARVQSAQPRILLVAFGAPEQDLWIERYLPQLPTVRVAMGVGGTFDFLAGARRRAPLFLRRAGMEWLWRLAQEPRRFPRIFRAVVVFPFVVVWHRHRDCHS